MLSKIKRIMGFLFQIRPFSNILLALLLITISCSMEREVDGSKHKSAPNFIIIFCDDLGYADISPFNQKVDYTPNLDRMSEEGMKFTSMYVSSPVCSPSRAALLTGRQPFRMGINQVFFPTSWTGLPQEELTLPEVLKENGYVTGMVGKWHLGHHQQFLPLQHGFDQFFGIPYSNDMDALVYLEGNEVSSNKVEQKLLTKIFTDKSLKFIENHKEEPFFLYLAHAMPHVPIYVSEEFEGKSGDGLYADVIKELDWSTGEILKQLNNLGLDENTVVVFTSDNGPWLAFGPHGGNSAPLREGKLYTFEGGMRVPTIIRWPKKIAKSAIYDGLASTMDFFPTFLKMAGIDSPGIELDGEDITQVLLSEGERKGDEIIYHFGGEFQGIRKGDWKLKLPFQGNAISLWKPAVASHDTLLINLKEDVSETTNLSDKYPEKVKELALLLKQRIQSYGELPASLLVRERGDKSHLEENRERLGID